MKEGRNELATVHCGNTHNLHISHNSRGFCIPQPGKVEPVYTGVTAHEQKGADTWEARSSNYSHVHKEPARMIKKRQKMLKDGGKGIKVDNSAHQEKNGFGSSGLKAGDLGEALVLQMCWTCCLRLYRMKTTEPLAQSVSPKQKQQGMIAMLHTLPVWFRHDEQQNSIQNPFCL